MYSEVKQVTGNASAQSSLKVYPNPVVNGVMHIESGSEGLFVQCFRYFSEERSVAQGQKYRICIRFGIGCVFY